MSKPTGFLEYSRKSVLSAAPLERINNFNEFHTPLSDSERMEQAARCMNCGVPFCQSGMQLRGSYTGCPLHNLIPEYNDLIYSGNWEQAFRRLVKTNNFPEFTGRVCPALCEQACTCRLNGEAVTSHDNEYTIIEKAFANGWVKPQPPKVRSGKRIAVVGSGPAGLTAADCLNKRGHSVTVFERDNMPGGLLMYGIPNMKLDKSIIKRRTDIMEAEGVEFRTGVNVDSSDITADYDAVILCCGAKAPRDVDVPGRDASGIYYAVDFLTDSTMAVTGRKPFPVINASGKNTVVVGGGDTGNDCVATAIREGCRTIVQLDRNPKAPDTCPAGSGWPLKANVYRPDYGQEEAIALFGSDPRLFSSTVKEILKDENGAVKEIVTIQIRKSTDKQTGKRIITRLEGTEKTIPCDMLILAAGFSGCEEYSAEAFKVERNSSGTIRTRRDSYATNVPNVFTAGDAHRGQSLVVWAIAEGRSCAKEVDEFLMGYTNM